MPSPEELAREKISDNETPKALERIARSFLPWRFSQGIIPAPKYGSKISGNRTDPSGC